MGSRDPQPIVMNFDPLGGPANVISCTSFCFDGLGYGVFVLLGAESGHFLYLATTAQNTVSGAKPCLRVMYGAQSSMAFHKAQICQLI
jgi:hypothetical protein